MLCLVEGITHRGEGVGRVQGQVVFIPHAIPGETVEVDIRERKKTYLRAQLKEVVAASPDRIEPACPYYYKCGGCSYQHMRYDRQLELKRQVVRDNLARLGGLEVQVEPVAGMDNPWRYRNKVEWHVARENHGYQMGYHIQDSQELLPIEGCLLIGEAMEALSRYLQQHLKELGLPERSRITVRQSFANGELMLVLAGTGMEQVDIQPLVGYPDLASVYCIDRGRVIHKYGRLTLTDRLAGIDYEISPLAFFQVNHRQAEMLIDIVKDYAQASPSKNVLEGYCGIGTISLHLARDAGSVIGVESYPGAVADARANARRNHISNCRFIAGACEKVIPDLKESFDVAVLDPPRAGCRKEVIEAVIKAA
ncbi:MAG: class I SAM-dependent RNA methyltransferase, partial [Syntrophomonadaceae bacterium]